MTATEDRKAITLGEEIKKETRLCGIYAPDHLMVTGYLCGNAELFAYAFGDACICSNGAPLDVREKMNPPKRRMGLYKNAMNKAMEYPRHLPDNLEEFTGIVALLSEGKEVSREKAKIVADVLQKYLEDYLGGVGSVQCYGEMPR